MIITCNNCNKKFDVDSSLIPDMGRLLQCASCDHKWFFKKVVPENTVSQLMKILVMIMLIFLNKIIHRSMM